MTAKKTVLIVANDPEVKSFLEAELPKEGYKAEIVENAKAAEKANIAHHPQILLVDLGIPEAEATIRMLRAGNKAPVLVLAANDQDAQRQRAFDAGAADYVMKPLRESAGLVSRMKTALRLSEKAQAPEMTFKTRGLSVDIWRRRVALHGKDVKLTPLEFDLLSLLVRRAGQVVTQGEIMKEVWDASPEKHGHYLRIYIQRLREKLGDDPFNPQYLFTEPKIGYRLNAESS
ncbi:MAG: winged helix-turn-helix domain-containing protein [Alphaproteobacteria bacterium]